MKNKRKIIFFDFDGVIADSFDINFEINKIIDSNIVTKKDFRNFFNGTIEDWQKNVSCSKEELKEMDDEFFAKYIPQMKNIKIFPGMKDVIAELAKTYTLLIVSSTIISPIRGFLKRSNVLSYFDDIVGSNFVDANKAERIKMVFKKYRIKPSDCLFVTDTLNDLKESAGLKIKSIAVTWGFHKKKNLLKGNPYKIVSKPKDILSAVSGYFNS